MKQIKFPKLGFKRRPKKLDAAVAAGRGADRYYSDEPKTNLWNALIVVLILHLVAVGGIYAFGSIRAARKAREQPPVPASTAPLVAKTAPPSVAPEKTKTQGASNAAPVSKTNVHRVLPGETLTKIAIEHGVTVAELEEANEIKNANGLRAGQTLTIPTAKSAPKPAAAPVVQDTNKAAFLATKTEVPIVSATAKAPPQSYVVAKGDTPTSIAKKFNTSSTDLLKLNKIDDPKKIQIGQTLKLPQKKN